MRTTARRDGDGWVLNGSQAVHHARHDRRHARRDGGDRSRSRAAAASRRSSSPRGTPGFTAGKKENKLGMRASDTSEVIFQDCRVPADGDGRRRRARASSTRCRCSTPAASASRRWPSGWRRARTRRRGATRSSGGSSASRSREFQAIRWKLADMATRIEAARLLTYRAAWLRDQQRRAHVTASSIAKLYSSEIAVRAAEECVQIHGGYGFVKDYPGREVLPRREALHDRRGHERDPAARDRAPAARPLTVAAPSLADRLLARDPRAIARAISLIENEAPGGGDARRPHLSADRPRVSHRRHRPARRRQEHARRSADRRAPQGRARRSACSPSIRRARTAAARFSAIACACRRTPRTPACSSAAWRRAGISAAWRARPPRPRSCSTRPGFDVVIIETVGVGQDEVDIVRTADVSIVTLVPGTGDEVQALKAGIMEIADIFVVNKADREGADRTAASIETMLSLEQWPDGDVAAAGAADGRDDRRRRAGAGRDDRDVSRASTARRWARAGARAPSGGCARSSAARFMQHLDRHVLAPGEFDRLLDRIAAREVDPYAAAESVMARAVGAGSARGRCRSITSASPCATPRAFVTLFARCSA